MIADFVTALESGTGVSAAAQTAIGEMDLASTMSSPSMPPQSARGWSNSIR